MSEKDIIRAADILIHRRGARNADLPRLTAAIMAAEDVAAHTNTQISHAFAVLTNGDAPWNLYFFPYGGKTPDSTWQHIAHAAIHGFVQSGRLDTGDDMFDKLNHMISTCHSAEGLTRRIAQLACMLASGPEEENYAIAPPKKSASVILSQLRGPHA